MKKIIYVAAIVVLFCVGCGSPSSDVRSTESGSEVTRAQLGDDWPLTVDRGVVDCIDGNAAIFSTGGNTYALNGAATQKGYQRIDSIWRDNPDPNLPKMNIGPLLRLALEQC